jgi:ribosomal protein S18 acetylase RimI-like enzyme
MWPYLEAENQAELLAYLGTASCAEGFHSHNITWTITGVDSNDYNGVVWTRLTPEEADHTVPALVDRFRNRKLPALWHLDAASQPADLAQRLERLDCRALASGVCMAAALEKVASDIPLPDGLSVQRVTSQADLSAWIDVWIQNDDEPRGPREQLYSSLGISGTEPLRHFIARLDGQAVGVSQLFLGARSAGLYCVSVLPSFRQRGIGTALTLTALRIAQREGYTVGVLGPSPEGQSLYQRLGFELFPSPFLGYTLWQEP